MNNRVSFPVGTAMREPRGNATAALLAVRSLNGTITERSTSSITHVVNVGLVANRPSSSASIACTADSIVAGGNAIRSSGLDTPFATRPFGQYTRIPAFSARVGR